MIVKHTKYLVYLLPVVIALVLCPQAWAGKIEAVGYDRKENGKFIYKNKNALTPFPESGVASLDFDFESPEEITFEYILTDDDFDDDDISPTITPGTISFDAILLNLSGLPWHSFRITLDGGATWSGLGIIRPDDQDDNTPIGGVNGPLEPTLFNVVSSLTEAVISFVNPILTTPGNRDTTGFEIGIPEESPNPHIVNGDWLINLNSLSVGDSFLVTFSPNDVMSEIPEPASLSVVLVGVGLLLRRRAVGR